MGRLVQTTTQIRAELVAAGELPGEPDAFEQVPVPPRYRRDEPAATGVVDIDLGIGRLAAGWDDIRRHAQVWYGEAPPPEPEPPRPPSPLRHGCPSEAQYRRHLKAGEKCKACRAHTLRLEQQRQRKQAGRKVAR